MRKISKGVDFVAENIKTAQTKTARTKRAIQDALIHLINEKGLQNITVLDISRAAKINRGTFYLHYEDKFDLVQQLEETVLAQIEQILEKHLAGPVGLVVDNSNNRQPLERAVYEICQLVANNFALIKALLSPQGDPYLPGKINGLLKNYLGLDEVLQHYNLRIPENYAESIIVQSLVDIINIWLQEDEPRSPEDITQIILVSRFFSPYGLIERDWF